MNDIPDIALLWVDIETTGLDYENDIILEMAWQHTDYVGTPLSKMQTKITVDADDEELLLAVLKRFHNAPDAVREMHTSNGLMGEVLFGSSDPRGHFEDVLEDMLEYVDAIPEGREVRLAGSSVGFDKRFLETAHGGELFGISHRIHDLSVLRPFLAWQGLSLNDIPYENDGPTPAFVYPHRAAADLTRDIAQWRGLCAQLMSE